MQIQIRPVCRKKSQPRLIPVWESAAGLLESFLCLVLYVISTSRSHFTGPPLPLEKKRYVKAK
jgi:hypothetical protein